MRRLAAVAALAAVALAACGGSSSSPGGTGPPRAPAGADEVVVRVVSQGGFAAESRQPAQLPRLSVYGDGRVITLGPTTLEFPGPALPNVQEFRLTGEGLTRVVDEARDAALLDDPAPVYGDPGVTDQATTTVTVRTNGTTRQVDVYALGFKGRVSGVTPEQSENRDRLERFIELTGDAGALGDEVVVGSERRFEPGALGVLVRPSDATGSDTHAWPLGDLAGTGCTIFTGDDLGILLDAARDAREGDVWSSGNATYRLTFRPLLPDDRTCDDVAR
jgi:hypothetical protein